ncbi:MAG: energy-coupling factor transporter ATPase [Oscillospiraceae bacterium]|jgi:energy-coupling factor transport system ATP-binding protein|nr:energy-coupling factor transporter ATPase [Oscillospiraceae bacterium]
MKAFIEVKNASFKYDKNSLKSLAIKNINMTINKGEFVAIIGHNGSGKSTLAKHFNAILVPTEGKVFVKKKDTSDENETYKIRSSVGLVLQNPDNQIVSSVVEDDVAFGPENLGIDPDEIRKRVDFALNAVGIFDKKREFVHKLSGGQKQKVAIASILAMNPECLVMDESTAMLDPQGRKELLKTLLDLNKKQNITVIIITHFMEEAVLANKIFVMKNGEIVDNGDKNIFSKLDLLRSCNLSLTQPMKLILSLKKMGFNVKGNPLNSRECANILHNFLKTNDFKQK